MTAVRRWTPPGATLSGRLPALAAGFAAAGLVALAAFTVLTTLYHVVRTHSAIPQADEWFSLALYDRILQHGDALHLLFTSHNEHRLFFPRLVFFSETLAKPPRVGWFLDVLWISERSRPAGGSALVCWGCETQQPNEPEHPRRCRCETVYPHSGEPYKANCCRFSTTPSVR